MREQHFLRGIDLKGHEFYSPEQWKQKLGKWTDFYIIAAEVIKQIPLEDRQEIADEKLNSLDQVPRIRRTEVRILCTLLESPNYVLDNLIRSKQT